MYNTDYIIKITHGFIRKEKVLAEWKTIKKGSIKIWKNTQEGLGGDREV